MNYKRAYTLVELIVAVGLFALIMLLASGAYLMMISLNRHAQGIATGIDNLSFAIETMTRNIRTGTAYSCGQSLGLGNCTGGGSSFTFKNSDDVEVTYTSGTQDGTNGPVGDITQSVAQISAILTDPSVDITGLTFYVDGTSSGDNQQPHVTISISGTVSYAAGKIEPFTIETGATMRGTDL
ncbi:MAG: prepilin-type N-terminal cleavage/methylation domain-containing protein [Candidatus Pacebacteria bacterium]|nr:prepilin-type N-terminal cleavage/methylation domain-containing protein [Candidatus Paceibacterota bacterium]